MIAEPLRGLARPITEFRLLDGNPRRGDVASVKRSLKRFGQRKPIVVREDGTVEAGNTTLKAALELGWSEIAVAAFGDDDATAKAFALADNRTSELGSFDLAALAAMAADVHAVDPGLLEAASFTEADLNKLLNGQKVPEKRTDPDAVPEPPAEPVTVLGDLWQLGPHRLLCGDATDAEALNALMAGERAELAASDPPYNVGEDYATYADALSDGAYVSFSGAWFAELQAHSDRQIITPGWNNLVVWCRMFEPYFVAPWTKSNSMTPGKVSRWTCWEPLMFFGGGWKSDGQRASDLFDFPIGHQKDVDRAGGHPCPKPAAFWVNLLENYSQPGATVLDVFGGSGTTLIAAHGASRVARVMELDPRYCDVICRRYQEHAGTKPVLQATGQPHDFTA